MKRFQYSAKRVPENTEHGIIEAESRTAAVRTLALQGLFAVDVTVVEVGDGAATPRFRLNPAFVRRRLGLSEQAIFLRELGDLLGGGLTVYAALGVLEQQVHHAKVRPALADLRRAVRDGDSLSGAMEARRDLFSTMVTRSIRAGEAGGALEGVLSNLADYSEQQSALRRKMREALTYPAFVAIVALGTIVILFATVIPRITALYSDLGQSLPLPTRLLLRASAATRLGGLPVAAAVGIGVFLSRRHLRRSSSARLWLGRSILQLPIVGRLTMNNEITRFARGLAVLLDGGVPALEALQLAAESAGNPAFAAEVEGIRDGVSGGQRIGEAMRRPHGLTGPLAALVEVGEENGNLAEALRKVAKVYEREVETALKQLTTLVEPALVLGLGLFIALVFLAMMLPILDLDLGAR